MAQPLEAHTTSVTETTTDSSLFASLGLNGQQFLFQLFNFALVFVIIWFLVLKPLTKKMEERKHIIDESLEKAEEIDTVLRNTSVQFQEKIDEAKVEANKIVAKAYEDATTTGEEMKKKAKEEIELLVIQAKKNIDIDKEAMRQELKQETLALVVLATEKILSQKLDGKKDEQYIQDILATLK